MDWYMILLVMFVLSVRIGNISIQDQIISSGMSEYITWIKIKTTLSCEKSFHRGRKAPAGEGDAD
jgi:hypothetical protein